MVTIERAQYYNKGFRGAGACRPLPFIARTRSVCQPYWHAWWGRDRHVESDTAPRSGQNQSFGGFGADGPVVEQMRQVADTYVLSLPIAVGGAKKDAMGLASVLRLQAMFLAIGYHMAPRLIYPQK